MSLVLLLCYFSLLLSLFLSTITATFPFRLPVGPAGLECAETLRQCGYKGKILIVTAESDLPYDRTKLSKVCNCLRKEKSGDHCYDSSNSRFTTYFLFLGYEFNRT